MLNATEMNKKKLVQSEMFLICDKDDVGMTRGGETAHIWLTPQTWMQTICNVGLCGCLVTDGQKWEDVTVATDVSAAEFIPQM